MTSEKKQEFTLRITQANKTQMITILYEMTLEYLSDARIYLDQQDFTNYHEALRRTRGCVHELMNSLNFEYELAVHLLELYAYINRELVMADLKKKEEHLSHIENIIRKLKDAYKELEKQDTSGPVMGNTQKVYEGLTYGRNAMGACMAQQDGNRGFRA